MKAACEKRDYAAIAEQDMMLHRSFLHRAGQQDLLAIWSVLVARVRSHFRANNPRYADPLEIYAEHRELIETFRRGDPEASVNTLEEHIISTAPCVRSPTGAANVTEIVEDEQQDGARIVRLRSEHLEVLGSFHVRRKCRRGTLVSSRGAQCGPPGPGGVFRPSSRRGPAGHSFPPVSIRRISRPGRAASRCGATGRRGAPGCRRP